MSTVTIEISGVSIVGVECDDSALRVDLADGRSVAVPLAWYPRLLAGTQAERANWRLIGRGQGVHWPDLDEDISLANMLAGKPSNESQASLRRWLAGREGAAHQGSATGR
jgi:hypothetical protein